MIIKSLLLLAAAAILYKVITSFIALRRNIKIAEQSGLAYRITPIYWLGTFWLATHRIWVKYLAKLPSRFTNWVDFALPESTYDYRYEIFKRVGHDTFLTVAAGGNTLFTCDPAVVQQIVNRRNDFPKPTKVYRALDIYGKNVVSLEGHSWRQHRKAVSPPFTEKNNHLVWTESIKHATSMLQSWLGPDGKGDFKVDRVMDDTMQLSLYVISGAGFGRKVDWPEQEHDDAHTKTGGHSKIKNEKRDTDVGHEMSWTFALHSLLESILFHLVMPRWAFRLPFNGVQHAWKSYQEWGSYMQEAVDKRKAEVEKDISTAGGSDILRQLVQSQVQGTGGPSLSKEELLGNMFVIILAGHETAANSIHFAILYLALHREFQVRLQEDLKKIFRGSDPKTWNYEKSLPPLFGGMAGAILAEELRLVPPVVNIPKSTVGVPDQTLIVEGKKCVVASNTFANLCSAAAGRNPKYWPHHAPRLPGGQTVHPLSNIDNDLEEFNPGRWLLSDGETNDPKKQMMAEVVVDDGLNVNEAPDTSDNLYKPVRGSYIPFSDGARACIGRRFAQVEVLAVLAVLYQNHSIELDVSKYATDAELETMTMDQKAEVWEKAAEDARNLLLNGLGVIISLQMRDGTVPVRVVPKGQETFSVEIDEIWKRNNPKLCSDKGDPTWKSWSHAESDRRKLA